MAHDDGRSKGCGIVEFETPEEAAAAIEMLNGVEMDGRPLLVREDREDRDLKQFGSEPAPAPPARAALRAVRGTGGRGGGSTSGGAPTNHSHSGQCSGLQVVVHGLPWSYTWRELKDLFTQGVRGVEHADVMYGEDGRSKGYGVVRFRTRQDALTAISHFHESLLEGRTLGVHLDKFA